MTFWMIVSHIRLWDELCEKVGYLHKENAEKAADKMRKGLGMKPEQYHLIEVVRIEIIDE